MAYCDDCLPETAKHLYRGSLLSSEESNFYPSDGVYIHCNESCTKFAKDVRKWKAPASAADCRRPCPAAIDCRKDFITASIELEKVEEEVKEHLKENSFIIEQAKSIKGGQLKLVDHTTDAGIASTWF